MGLSPSKQPDISDSGDHVIGIDMFQEKVMGAGPQDNESAIEQAKDEQMSDFIRSQVK